MERCRTRTGLSGEVQACFHRGGSGLIGRRAIGALPSQCGHETRFDMASRPQAGQSERNAANGVGTIYGFISTLFATLVRYIQPFQRCPRLPVAIQDLDGRNSRIGLLNLTQCRFGRRAARSRSVKTFSAIACIDLTLGERAFGCTRRTARPRLVKLGQGLNQDRPECVKEAGTAVLRGHATRAGDAKHYVRSEYKRRPPAGA